MGIGQGEAGFQTIRIRQICQPVVEAHALALLGSDGADKAREWRDDAGVAEIALGAAQGHFEPLNDGLLLLHAGQFLRHIAFALVHLRLLLGDSEAAVVHRGLGDVAGLRQADGAVEVALADGELLAGIGQCFVLQGRAGLDLGKAGLAL